VLAVVIVGLGAVAFAGSADNPESTTTSSTTSTAPDSSTVTFLGEEAHADLPPEPGCDQLYFHSTMAMFNPTLADEMLDYDCPFPFDPDSVSMEGGEEDPSIEAPYEARRYQELFDVLAERPYGICAVGRVNEPSVEGFVYGFTISAKADSCAASDPDLGIAIREYASRAHRDAAANERASGTDAVLVLGRFVITISASPENVEELRTAIAEIGADDLGG
jgi:hypothetical protein